MSDRKHHLMPESLLWLSNELYWKQNLAPREGAPTVPPPTRHAEPVRRLLPAPSPSAA